MPQTTRMQVQREFLIPIRSDASCRVLVSFWDQVVLYIYETVLSSQMSWSQMLCSLVSLPISIFPKVENTGCVNYYIFRSAKQNTPA